MLRRPLRSTRTYTLFPYPTLFRSRNVSSIIECDIPGTTDILVPHYSVWEFLSLRKFYFRTNSPQPAIESAFRKEEAKPCDALSSTSIFAAPTAIWPCRSCPRWTPKSSTARSTCSASWTGWAMRSEEHTSELQSLMRISYAVFCLKKKNAKKIHQTTLKQIYDNSQNSQTIR